MLAVIASLATLAGVQSAPAGATPVIPFAPIRQWQFSDIDPDGTEVVVVQGTDVAGDLFRRHDFGPATIPEGPSAVADIFSRGDGSEYWTETETAEGIGGTKAQLIQYQAFAKALPGASLQFGLKKAFMRAIDHNGPGPDCDGPDTVNCFTVDAMLHLEVSAYTSDQHLFQTAGTAFVTGRTGQWDIVAWTEGPVTTPLWQTSDFTPTVDQEEEFEVDLNHNPHYTIDLSGLNVGEGFTLRTIASASVMNHRGLESGALATLVDPLHADGVNIRTRGLSSIADPLLVSPPEDPTTPAVCESGPEPAAGQLQFSESAYRAEESDADSARVLVTRVGGSAGVVSASVMVTGGTAHAGDDLTPLDTAVTFADGDTAPRLVRLPILQDEAVEGDETVELTLAEPACVTLGIPSAATLTITDDERVVPDPDYAVTGTVDGLQGSGLVLRNNLVDETTPAEGSFAFTGRLLSGQSYDVTVAAQPTDPDQICTVSDGTGVVADSDITDVAVQCVTPAANSALDESFDSDGKVTTPGQRGAYAVAVQPSDQKIVVAGEFSLTRYDSSGQPDQDFGDGGSVITALSSGFLDDAADVAIQPDGKIVVVGIIDNDDGADATGEDFGIQRYDSDGELDLGFGDLGTATTDFNGGVDRAYAVAIDTDGSIVVAGHAADAAGTGTDFAVARYDSAGLLDEDFDADGRVTTDIAGAADFGFGVALQQVDHKIVVVGRVSDDGADGENFGVVRYLPSGGMDSSFSADGRAIADFGGGSMAYGVAIQPDTKIVVAGHAANGFSTGRNDFAVARFEADGELDTAFDGDGLVTTDFADVVGPDSHDEFGKDLALLADGRIVVVGTAQLDIGADLAVARYDGNGLLDSIFGSGGTFTTDFHGGFDSGQDVAVQSDGKIVATGTAVNGVALESAMIRMTE